MLGEYQDSFRRGYQQGYSDGYYGRSRNRTYEDSYGTYQGYNDRGTYSDNDNDRDDYAGASTSDFIQRAAQTGYRDGYERGRYDRSIGARRPNPQGHGAYEFGLDGWDASWGNQSMYRQYFRQYFLQGYEDGYYGRSSNFSMHRY